MRACSYFPTLLLLFVCGARTQRDFQWDTNGAVGDRLAEFQTGTKQSSEYYADTVMDNRSHNGTCFCLRETLVLREEAHHRSAAVATVEVKECARFNGRKALVHGDLWYEMQLLEGTHSGWLPSEHLEVAPDSACRRERNGVVDGVGPSPLKFAGGPVSQKCLQCICTLESGCKPIGCHWDVTSDSCGYFQIKNNYWIDCDKPGRDWKTCANDLQCSSQCVQNYMARYAKHYGCPMDCEGFAREHNGGPRGCKNPATEKYWDKLQKLPGCRGVKPWAGVP